MILNDFWFTRDDVACWLSTYLIFKKILNKRKISIFFKLKNQKKDFFQKLKISEKAFRFFFFECNLIIKIKKQKIEIKNSSVFFQNIEVFCYKLQLTHERCYSVRDFGYEFSRKVVSFCFPRRCKKCTLFFYWKKKLPQLLNTPPKNSNKKTELSCVVVQQANSHTNQTTCLQNLTGRRTHSTTVPTPFSPFQSSFLPHHNTFLPHHSTILNSENKNKIKHVYK